MRFLTYHARKIRKDKEKNSDKIKVPLGDVMTDKRLIIKEFEVLSVTDMTNLKKESPSKMRIKLV